MERSIVMNELHHASNSTTPVAGPPKEHGEEQSSHSDEEKPEEAHSHFREKAGDAARSFREATTEAKKAAGEGLGQLRHTASDCLAQGRDRAQAVGQTLQHRVQEQPISSLLMATGIGFLLGVLWMRKD
jgi:ElaB/YqjD/DUF883 family membrane-anchored ribosome-binding protein